MTEITILHISDLHFGITGNETFLENRKKVINSFFRDYKKLRQKNSSKYSPDIIVITGDIGYRGSQTDYKNFLNNGFLNKLLSVTGVKRENVFVCPGNHDKQVPLNYQEINFRADSARPHLYGDSLQEYAKLFDDYSNAMAEGDITPYHTDNSGDDNKSSFLYGYKELSVKGKTLCVIAQNSAWLCDYRQDTIRNGQYSDKGYLSISPKIVEETFDLVKKINPQPDAVITLFHHPKDWLKEDETIHYVDANTPRIAFDSLMDITDIFCFGHTHKPTQEIGRDCVLYGAGAVNSDDVVNASCYIIGMAFDKESPKKTTHCNIFKTHWTPDGKKVRWEIEEIPPKLINISEVSNWQDEKLVRLRADMNNDKKISQLSSAGLRLLAATKDFVNNYDECCSTKISDDEKVLKKEELINTFSEEIRRIDVPKDDIDTLTDRYTYLSILEPQNSTDAIEIVIAIFTNVLQSVDRQNKHDPHTNTKMLKLDPNDGRGGSDIQ